MPVRNYYRRERGEGRLKALVALAVIAAVAYVAMQFVPVYMRSIQMEDETQAIVRQAALSNLREADVKARLVEKAVEYNLPDNVKIEVTRNGKKVMAHVAYIQPVTLPYYTYNWAFNFRKEESGF
jgi:hypothetical protein